MTVTDLKINGVSMPTPAIEGVSIKREKIWSANTGRSSTGQMVGTVVAVKSTISITWPPLTPAQAKTIDDAVSSTAGFLPLTYTELDGTTTTKTVYFGTPSYTQYSYANGIEYVTGVSVDAVEQ